MKVDILLNKDIKNFTINSPQTPSKKFAEQYFFFKLETSILPIIVIWRNCLKIIL